MESLGVIYKVKQATPWYVGVVAVPKKTGSVRIRVNIKPISTNSHLDYQTPRALSEEDAETVITGLNGAVCLKDDVLVFTIDEKEHDKRLRAVLERLAKARITLNSDKCSFKQPEFKFLGHVLNKDEVSPDPEKTEAIRSMPPPKSIPELRHFLRMANQLENFSWTR